MTIKRRTKVSRLAFDDDVLAVIDLPKGPLRLTRGPGSGLAKRTGDPAGKFWAIGDRGPNLKIELAVGKYGMQHLDRCCQTNCNASSVGAGIPKPPCC